MPPSTGARPAALPSLAATSHWYRGAIVRGRRRVLHAVRRGADAGTWRASRALAIGLVAVGAAFLAGCGGGTRQDAHEPASTFQLKVLHASFPLVQSIARPTRLALLVRNTGTSTVPNVAVTIDSFDYTSNYAGLAANKRPVWVIEHGPGAIASPPVQSEDVSTPGSGQTAYINTWALGPLAPGRVRAFIWQVVPVKSGAHVVRYSVAAGLSGKSKTQTPAGTPVAGHFPVLITKAPPPTHVNPNTGKVEVGNYPITP
jgi:hypothetical protein